MYNFKENESLYTTIIETSAPTTSTVGIVGQKYLDSSTQKYYVCTAIDTSSSTYTWEELAKQSSVDNKLDTTGGTISGNLAVQGNLTVTGETTTEKQKTLDVEDNFIYTNANKVELTALLSGIAIYKNGTDIYAIAYDPATDSVKLGLGTRDAQGVFHFNTGEGSPVAVRVDSAELTDNHIIVWDATNHKFIDSGKTINDVQSKLTFDSIPVPNSQNPITSDGVSFVTKKLFNLLSSPITVTNGTLDRSFATVETIASTDGTIDSASPIKKYDYYIGLNANKNTNCVVTLPVGANDVFWTNVTYAINGSWKNWERVNATDVAFRATNQIRVYISDDGGDATRYVNLHATVIVIS